MMRRMVVALCVVGVSCVPESENADAGPPNNNDTSSSSSTGGTGSSASTSSGSGSASQSANTSSGGSGSGSTTSSAGGLPAGWEVVLDEPGNYFGGGFALSATDVWIHALG